MSNSIRTTLIGTFYLGKQLHLVRLTFPAPSSSFLSFSACPDNIFISTTPAIAMMGTIPKSKSVNCQP